MPGKGKNGRTRKILLVGVGLAALYFLALGGNYTFLDLWRLRDQRKAEAAALDSLRAEVRALQAEADSLKGDSAFLERLARERYGLIRNGERLYRFVGPMPDSLRPDSTAREPQDNP
ncbi:MAG TPA: septum formation initiator family protein [Longimicrobiales bacterium]|nr:septum formation initiator family protein [Longimicrobiales bacterium]